MIVRKGEDTTSFKSAANGPTIGKMRRFLPIGHDGLGGDAVPSGSSVGRNSIVGARAGGTSTASSSTFQPRTPDSRTLRLLLPISSKPSKMPQGAFSEVAK
ncbi:hypothetical protein OC834_007413, partial [Tilletia horrida]